MSDARPLSYNNIYKINASKDNTTSFLVGVYEGNASINVFSKTENAKGPLVKLPFPNLDGVTKLSWYLKKCMDATPGARFSISTTRYNVETKKAEPLGDITVGRDDNATPFIAISAPGISPQVYLIRSSLQWEVTSDNPDEPNKIALQAFIDKLEKEVRVAILNTSYKKAPSTAVNNNSSSSQAVKSDIPF